MSTSPWRRTALVRRLGATALVTAASTATLIGLDGTASAGTSTHQSVNDVPQRVEEDKTVTFSGTLTGVADQPVADEPVYLERSTGSGWSQVETEQTDSQGDVSFSVSIQRAADWRLTYNGDTLREGDSSAVQHVAVKQSINERIVRTAAAQAGEEYEYGADGPNSFDCSGLTQYVHGQVGIELPRTSSSQRDAVRYVSPDEKKPGDLIFFADGGDVYHVAVYAGDGQIWTAPQEGQDVHLDSIWDDDYTVGRAW